MKQRRRPAGKSSADSAHATMTTHPMPASETDGGDAGAIV